MKYILYTFCLILLVSCKLEPNITVDVPKGAVERHTSINVDFPETEQQLQESLDKESECEFNDLPQSNEGFVAKCTYNCCLWVYNVDTCVERWCLNLETSCGWELTDWNCHEN